MKPGERSPSVVYVVYEAFDAASHLSGVVGILASLEWDNFGYDPGLTRKSLTAPGVTTIIAVARDIGEVVGFSPRSSAMVSSRRTSACSRWTRSGAAGGASAGGLWKGPSQGWGPRAWTL